MSKLFHMDVLSLWKSNVYKSEHETYTTNILRIIICIVRKIAIDLIFSRILHVFLLRESINALEYFLKGFLLLDREEIGAQSTLYYSVVCGSREMIAVWVLTLREY